MLSVAQFLDKAKARAGIDSDYRLAKLIGITHGAMTNYRTDRSLPDERVIEKLCILTGDDPELIAAQFQSRRARTEEGRALWLRIADRLQHGGAHVGLILMVAIVLIAAAPLPSRADTGPAFKTGLQSVYYVK